MTLLVSDQIKINILKELGNSKGEISLNGLRKKIGRVNYTSVKRNCEFLEKIGLIKIDTKVLENKKFNFVSITFSGRKILEMLQNDEATAF